MVGERNNVWLLFIKLNFIWWNWEYFWEIWGKGVKKNENCRTSAKILSKIVKKIFIRKLEFGVRKLIKFYTFWYKVIFYLDYADYKKNDTQFLKKF